MAPERANQLKVLLSDDELEMLRDLAETQGLTVADFIRQFIRREHAEGGVAHLPRIAPPHGSPPKVVKRKPKK